MTAAAGAARHQITRGLAVIALAASPVALTNPSVTRPVDALAALAALASAVATGWLGPLPAVLVAGGALAVVHAIGGMALGRSVVVVLAACFVHWGLRHGLTMLWAPLPVAAGVIVGLVVSAQGAGWLAGLWAVGCLAGVVVGALLGQAIDRRALDAELYDEVRLARIRMDTWTREYPRHRCEARLALGESIRRSMGPRATAAARVAGWAGLGDGPAAADIEADLVDCFLAALCPGAAAAVAGRRVVSDEGWIRLRVVFRGARALGTGGDEPMRLLHMLVGVCRGVMTLTNRPGHGAAVDARVPRLRLPLVSTRSDGGDA